MKSFIDLLLGKPLSNAEEGEQRIGPLAGIPMLGLDALSSSAYGPEAAATVLIPLGILGAHYVLPITAGIIVLLTIVFLSYRQTISAYPNGGGSYTVARENLGTFWGLLAAAALLLDYVLVVAIGIAAGVGALISAIPVLQPHILGLCLIILVFITVINLRGVKESGTVFMLPTYLFVVSLMGVLGFGIFQAWMSGGHPHPVAQLPVAATQATETLSLWLLARAFASGCTAMTGVEAVSNGVKAFREPVVHEARKTLTLIIVILIFLLAGIAYLAQAYGVVATDPNAAGYESIISQLVAAIVGRGVIYYITISSVIAVLIFSANTGFADFPRMCQIIARDNFLPQIFAERGRRLVFSYGIIMIAILSGILLIAFGGITDNLIPLFAIGAFLAFTLSQAGMVVHWLKIKDSKNHAAIWINGLGAFATCATLLVVLVSKFTEGGWISAAIVFVVMVMFYKVNKHYRQTAKDILCYEPLNYDHNYPPIVIVPVRGWSQVTRKAMRFALNISTDIYGVHVDSGEGCEYIEKKWQENVIAPAIAEGVKPPTLISLQSPYRQLFGSLTDFISQLETDHPNRKIAVVIPSMVEQKWYHSFLHNQRAIL